MEAKKNGSISDDELVKLSRNGDKNAFGELVKRHEGKVYTLGFRFMKNREDAADVMQDTFLQAYRKLGSFEGKSAFSTWLYRIAVNICLMRKRKKKLEYVSFDSAIESESGGDDIKREPVDWSDEPLELADKKQVREKIEKALSKMPGEYREVVVLRDMDGFSNNAVADMLKISLPAVKSRLHKGRMYLRKELSDYFRSRGEL
ncbi:MAG: RNA polymerase subunit sigma-24 [Elusimicrobia bacterium CG_4_10_14_3_um_filter_49_12_50_7]|nr:MAG: RNA polymerase subunit sigma-24 [Elusimicrobia bacterium CG_4_8_14_3_um_filter_50_9]PIY17391.1 MAG: RNA polymerase subunit sigma-24 [Elusimicrobia bacterium CG_4_10_14_3_um_filter_49_12_50_7]